MMHREYFDSHPGNKGGGIADIVVAHGVNGGLGRVFITKEALALARSSKLDVYDIFRNKRERMHGTDGGLDDADTNMTIVTKGDVREHLDRRYNRLIK